MEIKDLLYYISNIYRGTTANPSYGEFESVVFGSDALSTLESNVETKIGEFTPFFSGNITLSGTSSNWERFGQATINVYDGSGSLIQQFANVYVNNLTWSVNMVISAFTHYVVKAVYEPYSQSVTNISTTFRGSSCLKLKDNVPFFAVGETAQIE